MEVHCQCGKQGRDSLRSHNSLPNITKCRSFQAYSVGKELTFLPRFHLTSGIHSETSKFRLHPKRLHVDWKETPEAHVFKANLPGTMKEEVKVEVEEGRVLQISGERNVEKEDKNNKWHHVERSSGMFTRRFRLSENVKMDQVNADMENGVQTIIVPREEAKKPDVKLRVKNGD